MTTHAPAATPAQRSRWAVRAYVEQVMGLPVSIHVRADDPDRPDVRAAVHEAWSHFRTVDAALSPWRADSELMRLRTGRLSPDDASPWMATVRALCDRATAASGGLFTTELVGPDGTRGFDPTGIVKGWSVDGAAQAFARLPGIAYAINAGGDIRCGTTPGGPDDPWTIGIENPSAPGSIAYTVVLTEGALATSGTAARGHHIVDPRTGAPAHGDLTSVTVVGPELAWADMWATVSFLDPGALAAAGPEWDDYGVVGATRRR